MSAAILIMQLRIMADKPYFAMHKSILSAAADELEKLSASRRELDDAAYKSGYAHGLAIGQEQQILSNSPPPRRIMSALISIAKLRQMSEVGAYAIRKQDLLRAADDLERLSDELEREKARLDWLLPRQHTHQTRESIDKEL